jgi:hypothetical protein
MRKSKNFFLLVVIPFFLVLHLRFTENPSDEIEILAFEKMTI